MMTFQIREVILLFPGIMNKRRQIGVREGTAMLRHWKEEELVKMPLHLQIVCLLELWGKSDDSVTLSLD